MSTGLIKLSYGNFTCSFSRNNEEEQFARAIISQIADVVQTNPAFGNQSVPVDPSPDDPNDGGGNSPGFRSFTQQFAPSQQQSSATNPMQLNNPVAGPVEMTAVEGDEFDSAQSNKEVPFMRSMNALEISDRVDTPAQPSQTDEALLEKYNSLRQAVIKMLAEATTALEAGDIPDIREEVSNIAADHAEEPVENQEPEVAQNEDQEDDESSVIQADLAPDNERPILRLIPRT